MALDGLLLGPSGLLGPGRPLGLWAARLLWRLLGPGRLLDRLLLPLLGLLLGSLGLGGSLLWRCLLLWLRLLLWKWLLSRVWLLVERLVLLLGQLLVGLLLAGLSFSLLGGLVKLLLCVESL